MKKINIKEEMFSRQHIYRFILLLILLISLSVSLVLFLLGKNYTKRTFVFPSVSGEYILEYRNINKNPVQGDVQFYIDEILLGPQTERTKMLFTPGTQILSCFQRDDVLYLDLSSDLLKMGDNVIDIKEGFDLLKLNVTKNFHDIKTIEFFVDGKIAFYM